MVFDLDYTHTRTALLSLEEEGMTTRRKIKQNLTQHVPPFFFNFFIHTRTFKPHTNGTPKSSVAIRSVRFPRANFHFKLRTAFPPTRLLGSRTKFKKSTFSAQLATHSALLAQNSRPDDSTHKKMKLEKNKRKSLPYVRSDVVAGNRPPASHRKLPRKKFTHIHGTVPAGRKINFSAPDGRRRKTARGGPGNWDFRDFPTIRGSFFFNRRSSRLESGGQS